MFITIPHASPVVVKCWQITAIGTEKATGECNLELQMSWAGMSFTFNCFISLPLPSLCEVNREKPEL